MRGGTKTNQDRRTLFLAALYFATSIFAAKPGNGFAATGLGARDASKIAIISDDSSADAVVDILTVELSHDPSLQLLERAEVGRIYREQKLAGGNQNLLKLGSILGADGLVLLTPGREGTNQFLGMRLVAVKPGVIIDSMRLVWPVPDVTGLARGLAKHIFPLARKLQVRPADAVPVSVLNLRSAQASTTSKELERQLTALTIEHLVREPEVFVLERRRLSLMVAEKETGELDDSSFWNGSYLIEGVIDRDGYTPQTVSLNVTLTPPHGDKTIAIAVSGSRTNLGAVVSDLAQKILQNSKAGAKPAAWNAAAEARRYFEEAQWAVRWGAFPQAQDAVESAWALGKRDLESASTRIEAWLPTVTPALAYKHISAFSSPEGMASEIRELQQTKPAGLAFKIVRSGTMAILDADYAREMPQLPSLAAANHLLKLYVECNDTLSSTDLSLTSRWYQLGLQSLEAGSKVLRAFQFAPASQAPVSADLAELRETSREIARVMNNSGTIIGNYWFTNNIGSHDALFALLVQAPSIFKTEATYGFLWQEKPEETLMLYRQLMSSAAFSYIHGALVIRDLSLPPLAGWNAADRQRLPGLWQSFLSEMRQSTNAIFRIEEKFIALANVTQDTNMVSAITSLFDTVREQQHFMATNMVEVGYGGDGGMLLNIVNRNVQGIVTPAKEEADRKLLAEKWPNLEKLRADSLKNQGFAAATGQGGIEKQKQFLRSFTPFKKEEFLKLFLLPQFSRNQSLELIPLMAGYRANLEANKVKPAELGNGDDAALHFVELVQNKLNVWLPRPEHATAAMAAADTNASPQPNLFPRRSFTANDPHQINTNRPLGRGFPPMRGPLKSLPPLPAPVRGSTPLLVTKFISFPTNKLGTTPVKEVRVFGQRARDGKLILDLRYQEFVPSRYEGSAYRMETWKNQAAAAILEISSDLWKVAIYPRTPQSYSRFGTQTPNSTGISPELFGGALYASDLEKVEKLDLNSGRWQALDFPGQAVVNLQVVNGLLYAANEGGIYEIASGGAMTHVLASTRRRPPVTKLDSLQSLYRVCLFGGPGGMLRAFVAGSIYRWNESDWVEIAKLSPNVIPRVFEDGVLFRTEYAGVDRFWETHWNQEGADLVWQEHGKQRNIRVTIPEETLRQQLLTKPPPLWKADLDYALATAPAAIMRSNVVFYVDLTGITNSPTTKASGQRDDRNGEMVCLDPRADVPIIIPVKFEARAGLAPSWTVKSPGGHMAAVYDTIWLLPAGDALFVGQTGVPGLWRLSRAQLENSISSEIARIKSK